MAEVIHKSVANCLRLDQWEDHALERVSVEVGIVYLQENNYKAIKLAASTLLEDLAIFEPPVEDISEDAVDISVGHDRVTATFVRNDAHHTMVAPGYAFVNYPALQKSS